MHRVNLPWADWRDYHVLDSMSSVRKENSEGSVRTAPSAGVSVSATAGLRLLPVEQLVFASEIVAIGTFRCDVDDPFFPLCGPPSVHTFVFPRTTVSICHEGGRPFTASPNVVTFYNRDQIYSRFRVGPDGDRCDWYTISPSVLTDLVREHDPHVADRPDRPFRFSHGPSDSGSYLQQRLALKHAEEGNPDVLYVEETILNALTTTLEKTYALHKKTASPGSWLPRENDGMIDAVQLLLAKTFRRKLSLTTIASKMGISVFHLCRVFRKQTGVTLHRYRHQLRLRHSLALVADSAGADLTEVALDLGYSSHSHFSFVFRKTFEMTPARFRRAASKRKVKLLQDISLADRST